MTYTIERYNDDEKFMKYRELCTHDDGSLCPTRKSFLMGGNTLCTGAICECGHDLWDSHLPKYTEGGGKCVWEGQTKCKCKKFVFKGFESYR